MSYCSTNSSGRSQAVSLTKAIGRRLGQRGRSHHQLGAVAVVLVGFDFGLGRRAGSRLSREAIDRSLGDMAFLDQALDAFEQPNEPLGAGVNDAGVLERGEELGCALQGGFGSRNDAAHEHAQVRLSAGVAGFVGCLARDREDRAFHGVVQRSVQPLEPHADGGGELARGDAQALADAVAEPDEELRQHHSRVAARAADAGLGHRLGDGGEWKRRVTVAVAKLAQGGGHGPQGEAHIRPRVAVGDRKNIDPIQLVAPGGHPIGRGQQRAPETRAVDVTDRDDRYSFTTVTRTSGRTSGWILMPTWKSPSSRIGSARSILRLSTWIPSSSSLRWMSLAVMEPYSLFSSPTLASKVRCTSARRVASPSAADFSAACCFTRRSPS